MGLDGRGFGKSLLVDGLHDVGIAVEALVEMGRGLQDRIFAIFVEVRNDYVVVFFSEGCHLEHDFEEFRVYFDR